MKFISLIFTLFLLSEPLFAKANHNLKAANDLIVVQTPQEAAEAAVKRDTKQFQDSLDLFVKMRAEGANQAEKAENLADLRRHLLDLQKQNYTFVDGFNPQTANDEQLKNYLVAKLSQAERTRSAGAGSVAVNILRACYFIAAMGCAGSGDVDAAGDFLDIAGQRTRRDKIEILSPTPSLTVGQ